MQLSEPKVRIDSIHDTCQKVREREYHIIELHARQYPFVRMDANMQDNIFACKCVCVAEMRACLCLHVSFLVDNNCC